MQEPFNTFTCGHWEEEELGVSTGNENAFTTLWLTHNSLDDALQESTTLLSYCQSPSRPFWSRELPITLTTTPAVSLVHCAQAPSPTTHSSLSQA